MELFDKANEIRQATDTAIQIVYSTQFRLFCTSKHPTSLLFRFCSYFSSTNTLCLFYTAPIVIYSPYEHNNNRLHYLKGQSIVKLHRAQHPPIPYFKRPSTFRISLASVVVIFCCVKTCIMWIRNARHFIYSIRAPLSSLRLFCLFCMYLPYFFDSHLALRFNIIYIHAMRSNPPMK